MSLFQNILNKIFKNDLNEKIDILINQNKILINGNPCLGVGSFEEVNPISDFEFCINGTQIKFDSILEREFKNELPKIHLNKENQELFSSTLSNLTGGILNTAIASSATRGLFRATANPNTLMRLSSGGISSAVVNGGKISQQSGFVQAGTNIFTPMVIFQFASVVTGQYYMNNISEQLNSVQEKLDELLHLFHIERQAKLVKSFKFIDENLNKKNFVLEDFVLIKIILSELTDIREEYFLMLEDSVETIKKNNRYFSFNSLTEAKTKAKEFEKTGFLFKMKTSLIADELFHLAKVAEFHMNLCYKNPDINRINLLSNKLQEISSFNLKDLCFNKTENLYTEIKINTLKCLEISKKDSWTNKYEIQEIIQNIEYQFRSFEEVKKLKLTAIQKTYSELTEPFKIEKSIVIDNRNGEIKLYIE